MNKELCKEIGSSHQIKRNVATASNFLRRGSTIIFMCKSYISKVLLGNIKRNVTGQTLMDEKIILIEDDNRKSEFGKNVLRSF